MVEHNGKPGKGVNNNLIPITERSPEERREICRKGAEAVNAQRLQRKTLAEELTALLSSPDVQKRLCTALLSQAMDGNTSAFQLIRDTIGEKPTEKTETTLKQAQAEEERTREKVKTLYDKIG